MIDTTYIPLLAKDKTIKAYALVDKEDYYQLWGKGWYLASSGYVVRDVQKGSRVYLHREIYGLSKGDGLGLDHEDRNKLNNRKSNLRICTQGQNTQNLSKQKTYKGRPTKSSFRGVSINGSRWMAYIRVDGKQRHLGYFSSEEEAAQAALSARQKFMPWSTA
jgi:hypothetical protein